MLNDRTGSNYIKLDKQNKTERRATSVSHMVSFFLLINLLQTYFAKTTQWKHRSLAFRQSLPNLCWTFCYSEIQMFQLAAFFSTSCICAAQFPQYLKTVHGVTKKTCAPFEWLLWSSHKSFFPIFKKSYFPVLRL